MKNTTIAFALLLAFSLPTVARSQTTIGVQAGVNVSSLAIKFDAPGVTLTTEPITRMSGGARIGVPITGSLGVRLDAGYAQRGGIWLQTWGANNSETEVTTESVAVTALVTLSLPLPSAYLLIGPGYEAERSCNLYSEWTGPDSGGPGTFEQDCGDLESLRHSDMLFFGGIGLRPFGGGNVMPFVEVQYAFGILDKDLNNEGFTVWNRGLAFSAGVDFAFGG